MNPEAEEPQGTEDTISYEELSPSQQRQRLRELATVFLRLGTIAFGGPAAHIAMMDDEVVKRRQWMSRENFLDLIGVTNLLPGSNSTELAIHIGYERAGWRGLLIAGTCFILPAMLIVWTLAALYARYQTIPQFQGLLYGIKPVIIAIVVQALWKLGQKAAKDSPTTVAIAYTISTDRGTHIRRKHVQQYVARVNPNRRVRQHSNFWIGLYGTLWIDSMDAWSGWAERLMRLKPQKRSFFLRGLRALSLIQSAF